jgi:hypothetical protein
MSKTNLFYIVANNDHDQLKQLIQSHKPINYNGIKSKNSLLSLSIKCRARECFDLLVNLPDMISLLSSATIYNGMETAISNYIQSQSESDKYYLYVLLEKNVPIMNIKDIVNCSNLFNIVFNYINDKQDMVNLILLCAIYKSNVDTFNKIYNYLDQVKPEYYIRDQVAFDNNVFIQAITTHNLYVIKFLLKKY